jgi:hypothetical protein
MVLLGDLRIKILKLIKKHKTRDEIDFLEFSWKDEG